MVWIYLYLLFVFFFFRKLFSSFLKNAKLKWSRSHLRSKFLFDVFFFPKWLHVWSVIFLHSFPASSKIGQEIKSTFISGFHRLKEAPRPKMTDIFKKKDRFDSWRLHCPFHHSNNACVPLACGQFPTADNISEDFRNLQSSYLKLPSVHARIYDF